MRNTIFSCVGRRLVLVACALAAAHAVRAADERTFVRDLTGVLSGDQDDDNSALSTKGRGTGGAPPSGPAVPFHAYPKAAEYAVEIAKRFGHVTLSATLRADHKYEANDCLGLKVVAGSVHAEVAALQGSVSGAGLVLKCDVAEAECRDVQLRFRPNLLNSAAPCLYSIPWPVKGKAENIHIEFTIDPIINTHPACHQVEISGDPRTTVRIGKVSLDPMPNGLDEQARAMISDAISMSVVSRIGTNIRFLLQTLLDADCPTPELPPGVSGPPHAWNQGSAIKARPATDAGTRFPRARKRRARARISTRAAMRRYCAPNGATLASK